MCVCVSQVEDGDVVEDGDIVEDGDVYWWVFGDLECFCLGRSSVGGALRTISHTLAH